MLTHPPIRVNGGAFQAAWELSIVSQFYVKSPDWFFSSSKQTYVSCSYLRLDATNPAAVTRHLPPASLSWSIFCWNSHLSSWCSFLPYDYSNSWLSIFIATLWAPTLTLQFRRLYNWECFLTKSFSINSYNFISVQSQAACTHEIVQNRLLVKVPAYMTKKIQTQEFEIDFFKIASYSFGGITVWLCSKPQKFSGFEI